VTQSLRANRWPGTTIFQQISEMLRLPPSFPGLQPALQRAHDRDQTIPSILGYFAGMLYNPNNVTPEAARSPSNGSSKWAPISFACSDMSLLRNMLRRWREDRIRLGSRHSAAPWRTSKLCGRRATSAISARRARHLPARRDPADAAPAERLTRGSSHADKCSEPAPASASSPIRRSISTPLRRRRSPSLPSRRAEAAAKPTHC